MPKSSRNLFVVLGLVFGFDLAHHSLLLAHLQHTAIVVHQRAQVIRLIRHDMTCHGELAADCYCTRRSTLVTGDLSVRFSCTVYRALTRLETST